MRVEERVKPAEHFKPEVASLNMGSINFGLFHLLDRYKEFKYDWEPQFLESTRDLVFRNSFRTSNTSSRLATITTLDLNSSATTSLIFTT